MKIEVAYADRQRQAILTVEVADNATVEAAIRQSGILRQFPEIDLTTQKVGVFGRARPLDTPLKAGDRVEIYRPVIKAAKSDDADDDS